MAQGLFKARHAVLETICEITVIKGMRAGRSGILEQDSGLCLSAETVGPQSYSVECLWAIKSRLKALLSPSSMGVGARSGAGSSLKQACVLAMQVAICLLDCAAGLLLCTEEQHMILRAMEWPRCSRLRCCGGSGHLGNAWGPQGCIGWRTGPGTQATNLPILLPMSYAVGAGGSRARQRKVQVYVREVPFVCSHEQAMGGCTSLCWRRAPVREGMGHMVCSLLFPMPAKTGVLFAQCFSFRVHRRAAGSRCKNALGLRCPGKALFFGPGALLCCAHCNSS